MTPRPADHASTPSPTICPYLGTATDRATVCLFVTEAHACYRFEPAVPAPADFQSAYCLSGDYEQCENFRAATPAQRVLVPSRQSLLPAFLTTLGGGTLVGVLVGTAVLLGVAVAVLQRDGGSADSTGGGVIDEPAPATVLAAVPSTPPLTESPGLTAPRTATNSATPSSTPATTVTVTTEATPVPATPPTVATQAAAATQAPTTATPTTSSAVATPAATAQAAAATPSPAPNAIPPELPVRARYRVKPGDSVTAIAAYYGARLDDVLRLNGLTLDSIIWVGQELLIP